VLLPFVMSLLVGGCEPADPLEAIRQQQESGDYVGTIEPLRELLGERPTDSEANYRYGRALVAMGEFGVATWPLRQAMRDPEWLVRAGLELAHAALASRDFNEAIEVTTRILEVYPDHVLALLFRAQAQAHWKKDPVAALADTDRVFELDPTIIEAHEPRILALLALDRHAEAREALAEAGQRLVEVEAPASTLAWHCSTTAIFADEGGDTERAREIWHDCLERFPSDPTVVMKVVQFYETKREPGDGERSIEALRRALAGGKSQRLFRTALAERLRVAGRPAEGVLLLQEATEVEDPRLAAAAWADLARFRHLLRQHGAAADALAHAVELSRPFEELVPAELLFRYADALVLAGRLDEALAVADEIPVPAQRRLIRGRVAQERGDAAGALAEYDEALRLWPNNPWARYYAALAAERLGDFDRALEEYRYAVRISVGATDARTRAARLLIAQGEFLLAYQLLFLEVAKAPLEPEGELLSMYLMARVANPKQLQSALIELRARDPERLPAALARAAEGAAEVAGPDAALDLLRDAPGVDYRHTSAAPVLRALVRFAHAAGSPQAAERAVEAALAAHPHSSVLHELRGQHRELADDSPESIRAAYRRAVELDPENAGALLGLGRLAVVRDPMKALEFFDRAAATDPSDPAPKLAAARVELSRGRLDEAAARLNHLLEWHPFEAEAAAELVALDLRRGATSQDTIDLARRAARFGGGADAYELLSRVYALLGQTDESNEAARRAEYLRELPPATGSQEEGERTEGLERSRRRRPQLTG
jgi:tetratricopeptide (TPR) repeat protein